MDEAETIRRLAFLVSAGWRQRRSEREIARDLVESGVPAERATGMAHDVKKAIQAGVQSAFTAGLSAPDGPPADPLLAEAFRLGHDEFLRATRRVWFRRLAVPLGLLLALTVAIVGWWLHWW